MSNLADPHGDDYPAAAAKHYNDAAHLHAGGRCDGAAYLAGYVRECSLKAVIVLDAVANKVPLGPGTTLASALRSAAPNDPAIATGLQAGHKRARDLKHHLGNLSAEALRLAAVPSGRVASYVPRAAAGAPPGALEGEGWRETMRYHAEGKVDKAKAKRWLDDAEGCYLLTVVAMRRDGVVFG